MRIVVSGHNLSLKENWAKWERFADKYPDSNATLLAPSTWETRHFGEEICYRVEEYKKNNFQVIPIKKWRVGRQFYLSIDMHLRELKPDILHIIDERYGWWPYQALAYRNLWARECVTVGYSYTNIEYEFSRMRHKLKEKAFMKGMDGIICGNTEAERILRSHGFSKPIILQQENGVDESVWTPGKSEEIKKRYGLKGTVIGYVGRLIPEKGVDDLIDATTRLSRKDWTLVIVGDGPMRKELENTLAIRGVRENARLLGFIPRAEIPGIMRSLDMLVLPSKTTSNWKEQFGLVLAEAMISGVAVIGSDSGAIPEVINDAGLVFHEGDVGELKGCLEEMIERADYRKSLAEKGLKRARDHFSTEALAEQSYEFFSKLLRSRKPNENNYGRPSF